MPLVVTIIQSALRKKTYMVTVYNYEQDNNVRVIA